VDRQLAQSDTSTNLPRRWAQWSWNTMLSRTDVVIDGNLADDRVYPDGEYTVTVVAVDTSGNRSDLQTLNVRVANDDTTKPVAQWRTVANSSSPAADLYDGKVLTSDTNLTVLGWDNNTVEFFEIWVGSTVVDTVSATDTQQLVAGYPFSATFTLDTREFQSGYHTLGVVAVDQAGNRSDAAFVDVIIVNNAPFVLEASRYRYATSSPTSISLSDAESISDLRITPIYFTVQPMDASLGLTVCSVTLNAGLSSTTDNESNTDYVISSSDNRYDWVSVSGGTRLGSLYPVSWVNGVPIGTTNLNEFALFPDSGNYRFVWKSEFELSVWVPGVGSALVVARNTVDDFAGLGGYAPDVDFSATVGVSHSLSGCASANQTQITFFDTERIKVDGRLNSFTGF
jgi:hypothetical protein